MASNGERSSALCQPYSQLFAATGGTGPYTWSVLSGSTGELNLAGDGTLTGTPTGSASLSFTVQVRDSLGNVGQAAFTLDVGQQREAVPVLGGAGAAAFIALLAVTGLALMRRTLA